MYIFKSYRLLPQHDIYFANHKYTMKFLFFKRRTPVMESDKLNPWQSTFHIYNYVPSNREWLWKLGFSNVIWVHFRGRCWSIRSLQSRVKSWSLSTKRNTPSMRQSNRWQNKNLYLLVLSIRSYEPWRHLCFPVGQEVTHGLLEKTVTSGPPFRKSKKCIGRGQFSISLLPLR